MKPKVLGKQVGIQEKPDKAILDTFPNPGVGMVSIETKEFTSLCPITGQPDWCKVSVDYKPNKLCVESKSLKLYLHSFRNERGFIEQLSARITQDIFEVIRPDSITVIVSCTPRGGLQLTAETTRRAL